MSVADWTMSSQEQSSYAIDGETEEEEEEEPPVKKTRHGSKEGTVLSHELFIRNLTDGPGPLRLNLTKSPSLLELIQKELDQANKARRKKNSESSEMQGTKRSDKFKAFHFHVSLLRVGDWEWKSRYEGDLVAKFYFKHRKIVWEIMDEGLKSKMEIKFSDIFALKVTCPKGSSGTLNITVSRQPCFFRETNTQPRKRTKWVRTEDFTGGQAGPFRHVLRCDPGIIDKHIENLFCKDDRLRSLSQENTINPESPLEPWSPVTENPKSLSHQDLDHTNDGNQFGSEQIAQPLPLNPMPNQFGSEQIAQPLPLNPMPNQFGSEQIAHPLPLNSMQNQFGSEQIAQPFPLNPMSNQIGTEQIAHPLPLDPMPNTFGTEQTAQPLPLNPMANQFGTEQMAQALPLNTMPTETTTGGLDHHGASSLDALLQSLGGDTSVVADEPSGAGDHSSEMFSADKYCQKTRVTMQPFMSNGGNINISEKVNHINNQINSGNSHGEFGVSPRRMVPPEGIRKYHEDSMTTNQHVQPVNWQSNSYHNVLFPNSSVPDSTIVTTEEPTGRHTQVQLSNAGNINISDKVNKINNQIHSGSSQQELNVSSSRMALPEVIRRYTDDNTVNRQVEPVNWPSNAYCGVLFPNSSVPSSTAVTTEEPSGRLTRAQPSNIRNINVGDKVNYINNQINSGSSRPRLDVSSRRMALFEAIRRYTGNNIENQQVEPANQTINANCGVMFPDSSVPSSTAVTIEEPSGWCTQAQLCNAGSINISEKVNNINNQINSGSSHHGLDVSSSRMVLPEVIRRYPDDSMANQQVEPVNWTNSSVPASTAVTTEEPSGQRTQAQLTNAGNINISDKANHIDNQIHSGSSYHDLNVSSRRTALPEVTRRYTDDNMVNKQVEPVNRPINPDRVVLFPNSPDEPSGPGDHWSDMFSLDKYFQKTHVTTQPFMSNGGNTNISDKVNHITNQINSGNSHGECGVSSSRMALPEVIRRYRDDSLMRNQHVQPVNQTSNADHHVLFPNSSVHARTVMTIDEPSGHWRTQAQLSNVGNINISDKVNHINNQIHSGSSRHELDISSRRMTQPQVIRRHNDDSTVNQQVELVNLAINDNGGVLFPNSSVHASTVATTEESSGRRTQAQPSNTRDVNITNKVNHINNQISSGSSRHGLNVSLSRMVMHEVIRRYIDDNTENQQTEPVNQPINADHGILSPNSSVPSSTALTTQEPSPTQAQQSNAGNINITDKVNDINRKIKLGSSRRGLDVSSSRMAQPEEIRTYPDDSTANQQVKPVNRPINANRGLLFQNSSVPASTLALTTEELPSGRRTQAELKKDMFKWKSFLQKQTPRELHHRQHSTSSSNAGIMNTATLNRTNNRRTTKHSSSVNHSSSRMLALPDNSRTTNQQQLLVNSWNQPSYSNGLNAGRQQQQSFLQIVEPAGNPPPPPSNGGIVSPEVLDEIYQELLGDDGNDANPAPADEVLLANMVNSLSSINGKAAAAPPEPSSQSSQANNAQDAPPAQANKVNRSGSGNSDDDGGGGFPSSMMHLWPGFP